MKRILLATGMILALAAPAAAKKIKAAYRCDDGTKLTATFHNAKSGPGSVDLYFPKKDKRMTLPQGMSADGGRYVSGKTQFWIKGNQATLTRGRRDVTCWAKS
jgi:membrane-bound inhibitor of C-type lysozyme